MSAPVPSRRDVGRVVGAFLLVIASIADCGGRTAPDPVASIV
ncbi:hypothetical protein ACFW9M_04460 [Streptomyces lydicus]